MRAGLINILILFTLVTPALSAPVVSLGPPAGPAPIVTLGSPLAGEFSTIDPRSIIVELLGAGNFVDLQIAISIHPFCVQPIDVVLSAKGDGGTFADQTGVVSNGCGSDTSVFSIRLNGDGQTHAFEIDFLNQIGGTPLSPAISVEIFPGIGDSDSDGISDQVDNCTEVANSNQRDTDADAIGNACDPDIATPNDCRINFADLSTMADAFFSNPRSGSWNADADLNGDGNVNFADLTTMQSAFFGIPGPSASGCN